MVVSMSHMMSILISAIVWPAWGFLTGWWYRRKSSAVISRDRWHLRPRHFESDGRWYDSRLRIRTWKDHLPETGGWFGLSKRQLPGMATDELQRFAVECRRGEMTHWAVLFATPVFAVWSSGWALLVVTLAGVLASVPFIAVLRFNRLRVGRITARRAR